MSVNAVAVEDAIRELGRTLTGAAGQEFQTLARDRAPRKSGDLIESIELGDVSESGSSCSIVCECTSPYGLFQDEGTGGSVGNPWIVFEGDGGEMVFLHEPRGTAPVPATHFWTDTVEQGPDIWQSVAA